MQTGDVLNLTPTELVAGGDALAKIDGFPVFITGLFPGDVARVELTEVKKGFARGAVVELIERGPSRRLEPCPVAEECGGCDWTPMRLDLQLEAKRRILTESLRRIGKFTPESLPPIDVHPSPLHYRLRSRLQSDGTHAGFFALRSNRIVQLPTSCEVVGRETAARYGTDDGRPPARLPPSAAGAEDDEAAQTWETGGREGLVEGDAELTIDVGRYHYRLSTRSFFQINRHLLGTMIELVESHATRVTQRRRAVDLYAGVGFFTLPLARLFDKVTAVDGAPESLRYARRNAPKNVTVVDAAVERYLHQLPRSEFTFLDPPRAGARQEVIRTVGEKTRELIAYLSCDPVTFSRDAGRLTASGWRLSTLDLLDLFPNTHHVETLASFERAQ